MNYYKYENFGLILFASLISNFILQQKLLFSFILIIWSALCLFLGVYIQNNYQIVSKLKQFHKHLKNDNISDFQSESDNLNETNID